jgi:hypothetical protein
LISENDIRQFYGSTTEMLSQQSVRTDCGYLLFYQAREQVTKREESVQILQKGTVDVDSEAKQENSNN